jgi:hypothetical protein
MFLSIIILLAVFLASTLGSAYLMRRFGYPIPPKPVSRDDYLIVFMKMILFAIIALLLFAALLIAGYNPLELRE